MSTVMVLSILLAAAVLIALWFWFGTMALESHVNYYEDLLLEFDRDRLGPTLSSDSVEVLAEEAALIREWREENTTTDD